MVLVVTFAKVPSTSIRKARESSDIVSVVLSEGSKQMQMSTSPI